MTRGPMPASDAAAYRAGYRDATADAVELLRRLATEAGGRETPAGAALEDAVDRLWSGEQVRERRD